MVKLLKKYLALFITMVMLISTMPLAYTAEAETSEDKSSSITSEELTSVTGAAIDMNFDNGKPENLTLYGTSSVSDGTLIMDGNAANYAEIPEGCLGGEDNGITISMDLLSAVRFGSNFRTLSIGQSANESMYMLATIYGGVTVGIISNGTSKTLNAKISNSKENGFTNVTITYNNNDLIVYMGGLEAARLKNVSINIANILKGKVYLGKSFVTGDVGYNGKYDNINIWKSVLNPKQVAQMNGIDVDQYRKDLAQKDLAYLTLDTDNSSPLYYQQKIHNPVIHDVLLWYTGKKSNYPITWKSSNPAIIGDDGKLIAVPGEDSKVTLTATIAVPDACDPDKLLAELTKDMTFQIPSWKTRRQMDYDAITIMNMNDVRENLPFIRKARNGSSIEWTSSNPAVISDTSESSSIYDGGVVTRPAAGKQPVNVKLTAVITMEGVTGSLTKTFDVSVTPLSEKKDEVRDKYLFTYYGENYDWNNDGITQEELYFGVSKDGLKWDNLNVKTHPNGTKYTKPMFTSNVGDKGLRDAYIIRSHNSDKFYIMATDLRAVGTGPANKAETGWNGSFDCVNGSRSLVVWETNDLSNWGEPRLVRANFDTAGNTYAPEAIWDSDANAYLVYWASKDNATQANGTKDLYGKVYCCYTRDFMTFSDPVPFVDHTNALGIWPDQDFDVYDTDITYDNGIYYRITTRSKLFIETSKSLRGPWSPAMLIDTNITGQNIEAPATYQLPDGRWILLGDNYREYVPYICNDLSDLVTGNFQKTTLDYPTDGPRYKHGGVIKISDEEYSKLIETYSENSKPITVKTDGILVRDKGIQASVDIALAEGIEAHQGDETVVFQLMKKDTPVSIVALSKDVTSQEKFTAYFNVEPTDNEYTVNVYVLDAFNSDLTYAPLSLANKVTLK